MPQSLTVELRDGTRRDIRLDQVLGHPERPLSREQHLEKFRRCWRYGATPLAERAGEEMIRLVDRLESVADVRELLALTVP